MKSRNISLCFVLLLALIQLCCASSIDREEAAVIRTSVDLNLERLFEHSEFGKEVVKTIYISSVTSGFQERWQKNFTKLSPSLDREMVDSFMDRNDDEYPVNPHLKFRLPHIIVPEATLQKILGQENGWPDLYRKHPVCRGILWFSRVGFNRTRTQALLYISHQWGPEAGEGLLILMKKDNGNWNEISSTLLWVS